MDDKLQLAGNVLSAATFIAGLLLAYIGSTAAAWTSIAVTLRDQDTKRKYQIRAWIAFGAFVAAIIAAVLALFSRLNNAPGLLNCALWVLGAAALAVGVSAFMTAKGIR